MVRLLLVSLVLLGIVVALRVRGGGTKLRAIRVTARASLHRGAVLAVVEVEGKRLLIGAGNQQVNLLAELDPLPPEEPVATIAGAPVAPVPAVPSSLLERIRRATARVPS